MLDASKTLETIVGIIIPLIIAGLGYLAYHKPDEYLRAVWRLSLLFFIACMMMGIYLFTSSWSELNQLIELAQNENLKTKLVNFKDNTENKILWLSILAGAPFLGIEIGNWIRGFRNTEGS